MKILTVLTALLLMAVQAEAADFTATINITGDLEIAVGDTTTLTAIWTTSKDVTRSEWSVDGTGQGIVVIDASSGVSTFDFSSDLTGNFVISFRIWHHSQRDRDATRSVTVTVTEELNGEWKNHGQYVSSIAKSTPSGPGKGAIVSEAAKSDIGKKK